MNVLPKDLEDLIMEYIQDPDQLVIKNGGKYVVNRSSNKIKEIGAIILMKLYYPLFQDITNGKNRYVYFYGKLNYMNRNHYLIDYESK